MARYFVLRPPPRLGDTSHTLLYFKDEARAKEAGSIPVGPSSVISEEFVKGTGRCITMSTDAGRTYRFFPESGQNHTWRRKLQDRDRRVSGQANATDTQRPIAPGMSRWTFVQPSF